MDFLLLQCGIGNGKIILLKSSSTNGPYCCISDEILNLKGSVAKLKLYAHLYKTIKANIVLTVKSFVSINYFSFSV